MSIDDTNLIHPKSNFPSSPETNSTYKFPYLCWLQLPPSSCSGQKPYSLPCSSFSTHYIQCVRKSFWLYLENVCSGFSSPLWIPLLLYSPLPPSVPGALASFLYLKHASPSHQGAFALALPSHWYALPPDIHRAHTVTFFKSLKKSDVTCSTKIFMTLFKNATMSPLHYSIFKK